MKIQTQANPGNVTSWEELRRWTGVNCDQVSRAINGGIDLIDNCSTISVSVTIEAANSDTKVTHGLERMPNGYIVIGKSGNITVFDGTAASTTSELYIQATATGTVKLLVF